VANIFNARVLVHPSFVEPDLVITTAQASGFMDALGDRSLRVKLGPVDKFVYMNRIDLRTQVAASQAAYNALPSATIVADYLQTATYRVRVRAEYNELDVAEAGEYNVALPMAQRLAMRQGIFQYIRTANLFGVNAANSEGLLNTPNSTATNLPPDSYGNTTLQTYDAGELAIWFLGQLQAAWQRMYMLGTGARAVLLGPQRILGQMQLVNIVQTTSYQRAGAGTATTAQVMKEVAKEFGYELEYAYDDTLIGAGATIDDAASDAVLLVVPEAIVPSMDGINTNEFNKLGPTLRAMTLQYADVAAPVEITTPIVEGLDVTSQMRISSGWCPRGQAITILSIPY
jgi:hypothetical protein